MKSLIRLGFLGAFGSALPSFGWSSSADAPVCQRPPSAFALSDPPYDNYFYSDCNVAAQVVVTNPLPDSDLSQIRPRLIVAWPGGNSGMCAYFAPQNGVNGSLGIKVVNSTVGEPLAPVYTSPGLSKYPGVGVKAVLHMNSSATLSVPILGSIRTIRDYVEGGGLLDPQIQDAVKVTANGDGGASLQRRWLDNITTSALQFYPVDNSTSRVMVVNNTLNFESGDYLVSAQIDYPQLTQLPPTEVLAPDAAKLVSQQPDQVSALSFLSYSEKIVAGAWRFLTYFGRDSMVSALLLEPVLSKGNGSAMEAVIGAVLERINRTDGTACHEETLGDYATWLNMKDGVVSNDMVCDYKMIDTDYFLPVLMQRYLVDSKVGRSRRSAFLSTPAGSVDVANKNLTWGQLSTVNAERVMRLAQPFARNHTKENLIHLKEGQVVGQWRDSTYGIGGGRIPFDVNTALVPAALRSIAALTRHGVYPNHTDWGTLADQYADIWEDKTLPFFEITIPQAKAQSLVQSYANKTSIPSRHDQITSNVTFYALALDGNSHQSKVRVLHSDDSFRLFLLNTTTNQPQLTSFINQTATHIQATFPAGLMTDASMVVANPAYGDDPVYARNWTTGAYHGTVVWSWQLALMARGLENQLARCQPLSSSANSTAVPAFCSIPSVHDNVKSAYRVLWDSIENNTQQLSSEVWSWVYREGKFAVTPLGVLPPPDGGAQTESNIRQLWSLAFLGVRRNTSLQ
ncbi:hypothetical protein BDV26DRAFT_265315 [Aspergillus bertholletiae]|uniref:Glycogen debranching enzyme n=1 Tax=Aspergillus bertholletiae TaxID=1226010 RepID=A0A5N7B3I3_9EURO|nr:hypothetical protein BDV26DRAFT_265315 [Aspergillus bertholletiae]